MMKIDNLGCVSRKKLLGDILPGYNVDLRGLGVEPPRCSGVVQQYKWSFVIDRPLDGVAGYFREDRVIRVLKEAGKPSLKQFELNNGYRLEPGARGTYWIKKPLTIARGEFVITHAGMDQGTLRVGYVRVEDLRCNWALAGMLDKSGFGFSVFEFAETPDGNTLGSYYLAQQLPGHLWGWPLAQVLKRKLNNPAFYSTFTALKHRVEAGH